MKIVTRYKKFRALQKKIKDANLLGMYETSRYIQPYFLFYAIFNVVPNKAQFEEIDKKKVYKAIREKYAIGNEQVIRSEFFSKDGQLTLNSVILIVRKEVMVYLIPDYYGDEDVEILYSNRQLGMKEELQQLINKYKTKVKKIKHISLMCYEHQSITLKPFEIRIKDTNIHQNYNDDLVEVDTIIKKRLKMSNDKGIILMHGVPGTGKTSYIRHLINHIGKRMIYLPPDYASYIASPEFITFMLDYPNSVLIIEDAENIIEDRASKKNAAISNLLNASDGLLSDCLNMQIICTFNTDLSRIDSALLRKGRLIAKYEFLPLRKQKAVALVEDLGLNFPVPGDMTLAEIYNCSERGISVPKIEKIGFKTNIN